MNTVTEPVADFKRDRWGRPLVVPAGKTRALPYVRASAAAKTIEDTYNLELWARRNAGFGMAHDASLVARILAIGGEPGTWDQPTKTAVNKIMDDAAAVAKAHKAADIGTAVHRLTEQHDLGLTVTAGPYQADLDAYTAALATANLRIVPSYVECRMVCDELQMAGTADRLLRTPNGTLVVGDIKTSASVEYGALGWAAQLAAYANSDLYNPADDTRQKLDELERGWGVIIHLPAGKGTCDLYRVDLVAGLEAARLANTVRTTRTASKAWLTPHTTNRTEGDSIDLGAHFAALETEYRKLPDTARLWIGRLINESMTAGVSFRFKAAAGERSVRRWWIARALVTLAAAGEADDDTLRALLSPLIGPPALDPALTTGHVVGTVNATQAEQLARDATAQVSTVSVA